MTRNTDATVERADEPTHCPECRYPQLRRDDSRGELVCPRCGLVVTEGLIDPGAEWRAFDQEQRDKRARTGAPMTMLIHDKGLSTDIDWRSKDSYGRALPARSRAQLYRLRKWHRRVRVSSSLDRNLAFALGELDRMASRMGLARAVRETSAMIYRRAVHQDLIRGRSIEGVAAASLYAACRQCGVPRTLDEIADASRVRRREIGRTYRFLAREMKLKLPPTDPLDYVPRFASGLKLPGHIQAHAAQLVRRASEAGLTNGKGPMGVAAAAIYIASILGGERRTQEDIAEVSGVTEVTIRNRYKELAENLEDPGPDGKPVPIMDLLRPILGELHKHPLPARITEEDRMARELLGKRRSHGGEGEGEAEA